MASAAWWRLLALPSSSIQVFLSLRWQQSCHHIQQLVIDSNVPWLHEQRLHTSSFLQYCRHNWLQHLPVNQGKFEIWLQQFLPFLKSNHIGHNSINSGHIFTSLGHCDVVKWIEGRKKTEMLESNTSGVFAFSRKQKWVFQGPSPNCHLVALTTSDRSDSSYFLPIFFLFRFYPSTDSCDLRAKCQP